MHLIAIHKQQTLVTFWASNAQIKCFKLNAYKKERNQSFLSGKCNPPFVTKCKQKNKGISGTDKTKV